MTDNNAAQSNTRRGPRIIGQLLFCWSWFVAGALLLIFTPPVLLVGSLANRQVWIYWWAEWGARTWLRLTGVKVNVTGQEHLDPKQTYVFVANHWSYLDAAPLFAYTGRRMGMGGKTELMMFPPVETSLVASDQDLDRLVQRVQGVIMKELGVKPLARRPSKIIAPENHK